MTSASVFKSGKRCVYCRKLIEGEPYNSESWVGAWCSLECQEEFDLERETGYNRRKGIDHES